MSEAVQDNIPVYIAIGTNINPVENTRLAVASLRRRVHVFAISNTWETPPVGTVGPNFYNTALAFTTHLGLEDLKSSILRPIESQMGRIRTHDKNAPRTIDLDPVIVDGQLVEPRLWSLAYLAVPIAEIYPDYQDPKTGTTLAEIARQFLGREKMFIHPEVLADG